MPRVIGLSQRAQVAKSGGRAPRGDWDAEQALAELEKVDPMLGEIGRDLMSWVASAPGVTFQRAHRVPEIIPAVLIDGQPVFLISLTTEGRVYLGFHEWTTGLLSDPVFRQRFASNVAAVVDPARKIQSRGWPFFEASRLADPQVRARFFAVLSDVVAAVRSAEGSLRS